MLLLVALAGADPLRDLADRFAPVVYQDVADGVWNDSSQRWWDFLTTVDYDGDLDPANNVENIEDHPLRPAVYCDAVETETHVFLLYSFLHPIDWDELGFVDHENDMEHAWLVAEKSADGTLRLLVAHTQAHGQLFGWSGETLTGKFALTDGGLQLEDDHLAIFIESHGHGPASCTHAGGLPFTQEIDCDPPEDEHLVIYRVVPGATPAELDEPDAESDGPIDVGYALVSAGGVPPWGYLVDDSWLGGTGFGARGDWLMDPAALFAELYRDYACSDREPFFNYLANPYVDDLLDSSAARPWDGIDQGRRCDGTIASDTGQIDSPIVVLHAYVASSAAGEEGQQKPDCGCATVAPNGWVVLLGAWTTARHPYRTYQRNPRSARGWT